MRPDGWFRPRVELDPGEYKSMVAWVLKTKGEEQLNHINKVKDTLRATLATVRKVAHSYDWGRIRSVLFVPFGGPSMWNRWMSLMMKEIELANEGHFAYRQGDYLNQQEDILSREWALSGMDRLDEIEERRELGHGRNPVTIPDHGLATE